MVDNANIKVFECYDHAVIFNGSDLTLKLFPLQLYRDYNIEDTPLKQAIADASMLFEHVQSNFSDVSLSTTLQTNTSKQTQEQRPVLHRLSLTINNTCNMACKYCYANKGSYYTQGILMDKNTALNAVNFAFRNFSHIEHVNFFGGEPTLNPQIMELVCEYFIYLNTQGVLTYLPRFGLTTNGYIISGRVFQLLRKYKFSVTISLDGPKEIHDKLRVSINDSGTYDAIIDNVKAIIDMGIIPEFECTYTAEHYRSGIDLIELMNFFYDNFHCLTLHCPMVTIEPHSRLYISLDTASELYADAIGYSICNLMRGIPKSISVAKRLLNSLTTRTPICHYCPAGKSSITINADGNIYSCFMLMRGSGFCLGNVNGMLHEFGNPDLIVALIEDSNKWQNLACRDCWAQPLCFGCLGEDIDREGTVVNRSAIQGRSTLCDFKRKIIEVFLTFIAEAYLKAL